MNHYQKLESKLKNNIIYFSFEAIGTKWIIAIEISNSIDIDFLKNNIIHIVHEFDKQYSRFRADSILYSLKNKLGKFKVGSEFVKILKFYKEFHDVTFGAFSPFSGIVLDSIGYDKDYSFKIDNCSNKLNIPSFNEAIKFIDSETIFLLKKISLDFGAIGKGFLVDKIYSFLLNLGINYFFINAGGDIRFYSKLNDETLSVGLENPLKSDEIVGIYPLKSTQSICGSSILKRSWMNKNHIIDFESFNSVSGDVIASFVVADSACIADALATIFLLPKFNYYKLDYKFESLLIFKDLSCRYTDGFKEHLF